MKRLAALALALSLLRDLRRGRNDLPNEFWRDEVNGATLCFVAEDHGELAAVTWLYEYPAKRPMLTLAPGDAEASATHSLPAFRGRSLYRTLSVFAAQWWLARNAGRIFSVAASDNEIPLAQLPRMGYIELTAIHRISLFGPRFRTAGISKSDHQQNTSQPSGPR